MCQAFFNDVSFRCRACGLESSKVMFHRKSSWEWRFNSYGNCFWNCRKATFFDWYSNKAPWLGGSLTERERWALDGYKWCALHRRAFVEERNMNSSQNGKRRKRTNRERIKWDSLTRVTDYRACSTFILFEMASWMSLGSDSIYLTRSDEGNPFLSHKFCLTNPPPIPASARSKVSCDKSAGDEFNSRFHAPTRRNSRFFHRIC